MPRRVSWCSKDDVLGHVDDSDAQIRKLIAESELKSAQEQAASDANLKAAEATIGVALAEYEGNRRDQERGRNRRSANSNCGDCS